MNITENFIDSLYNIRNTKISDEIVLQAKRCLLDYLGATLVGAEMIREKGDKLLSYLGQTNGDITVVGFNKKTTIENAAFINGLSSHVAELDDGVRFGMIHPGAPVFSALLPVAETEKVKGTDLLLGILTGYEAAVRIACAIQPSHYNRGYHPTGTCGTIGAALGIAAMLGFSKSQMKDTLSSAAISASGTLKVLEDGSELKPLNVANAALNGLFASFMARVGFKGPNDVLAGDNGFFAMMAEKFDLTQLERKNNETFYIEKVYVKPYASCRHTHPSIEAALKIRLNNEFCADNIENIKVFTYHGVIGKHDHTEINGASSAKMSIPYSIAAALVTGKAGINEFTTECVNNPIIISLTKKVNVCSNEEFTSLVPQKRVARVEIKTYDGICYAERVDFPKGEPENPFSDDEVKEKFISLAKHGEKTEKECQKIIKCVWNFNNNLCDLFESL